jgi:serine/threonine protein kinase
VRCVLVLSQRVVVIDFDHAREVHYGTVGRGGLCTVGRNPPEVSGHSSGAHTKLIDSWGVGLMLFEAVRYYTLSLHPPRKHQMTFSCTNKRVELWGCNCHSW